MAYKSIDLAELLSPQDYEKRRRAVVANIIKLKDSRRVEIGPWVSVVFENRRTVVHQIQEMIRIERLTDPVAIRHEIETYEDLVPKSGELSSTFFIEIAAPEQRQAALSKLGGIEKTAALSIAGRAVAAFDKRPIDPQFERPGQATAVYYLGFRIPSELRKPFVQPRCEVWFKIAHPHYSHAAALPPAQRAKLACDWT